MTIEQAVQCPEYGAPLVVLGAPLTIDADAFKTADGDLEGSLRLILGPALRGRLASDWDKDLLELLEGQQLVLVQLEEFLDAMGSLPGYVLGFSGQLLIMVFHYLLFG